MASNTLDALIVKILARSVLSLREMMVMPRLVNSDYSTEAATQGAPIEVPIPSTATAGDVTPGPTPPASTGTNAKTAIITLDRWKQSDFHLTDKNKKEILDRAGFIPGAIQEAINALARVVNADIFAEYKKIFTGVGTAGTTPFASDAKIATAARKALLLNLSPMSNLRGVLDPDAEENALNLATFADAEKTGESGVKIRGDIGMKYGFQWVVDQQVPTHTIGAGITTVADVGAAAVIGANSVTIDTDGSGEVGLLVGDIVVFVDDTQQYVVTADLTIGNSSSGTLLIEPGLKIAKSDEVIAMATGFAADHVVNLCFHRDAFAFAMRPLADTSTGGGNIIRSVQDPETGIVLRLEISREHKQDKWDFDILYGTGTPRPELAVRVAG